MKLRLLTLFASLCFITGCDITSEDSNNCFSSYAMATTGVTGPDTTTVNTPIVLNVTYFVASSCGVFNNFVTSTTGNTTSIVVQVDYNGCNCNQTPGSGTKPYTFTATAPGTYQLKFLTDNIQTPIIRTITVTE